MSANKILLKFAKKGINLSPDAYNKVINAELETMADTISEVDDDTVKHIDNISLCAGGAEYQRDPICTDRGIRWEESFDIGTDTNGGGDATGVIYQEIPIVSGNTMIFAQNTLLYCLENLVGKHYGICEILTAVNNSVADSLNLIGGREATYLTINKSRNKKLHCGRVIGEACLLNVLRLAGSLVDDSGTVNADSLAITLGKNCLGLGIKKLILKRAGAGVYN